MKKRKVTTPAEERSNEVKSGGWILHIRQSRCPLKPRVLRFPLVIRMLYTDFTYLSLYYDTWRRSHDVRKQSSDC